MSKQYGLILPASSHKKTLAPPTQPPRARPSIFDEDDDDDDDNDTNVVGNINRPTGLKRPLKKQEKISQSKAIAEDPTVYQYDEIYDAMDQKRRESKLSRKDLDKKPKYISKLLAAADRRKRENELRIERQVQKDREAEGEEFKDKDSFVTSAYRKKLEEMKELEDREKREEYLETIGDVTKQGNLDGFYRHLYEQKVKHEESDDGDDNKKNNGEENVPSVDDVKEEEKDEEVAKRPRIEDAEMKKPGKQRRYRKRAVSDAENEKESDTDDGKNDEKVVVEMKKEHLPSNLDADSDFSIDSSSDSETDGDKTNTKEKKKLKKAKIEDKTTKENDIPEEKKPSEENPEVKTTEITKKEVEEAPIVPTKPKIDIWKKRTVGEVFQEALQRYFERRTQREL